MENILRSLTSGPATLSLSSITELTSAFTRREYPKRYHLVRSGQYIPFCFFIEKGITRSYFVRDGREITHWFSKEGDITFGMETFYHNEPATENVQLLEPCVLYSIPIDTLNELYNRNIEIANWGRVIHQEAYRTMHLRHISRLYESARERYEKMLEEHPDIFARVNLGYIASYLGISQVTLSKLRAGK